MRRVLLLLAVAFAAALLAPGAASAGSTCRFFADIPATTEPGATVRVVAAGELHCPSARTLIVTVCAQQVRDGDTSFPKAVDCRSSQIAARAGAVELAEGRPFVCAPGTQWRSYVSMDGFVDGDISPFTLCHVRR